MASVVLQYFLVKNAVAGQMRNNVTLAVFIDPDGGSVTYTVLNRPAWLTPAGSNVVNIGPTAPEGRRLLTVQASDSNGTVSVAVAMDVLRQPSLTRWQLTDGKPEIEIASQYCTAAGRQVVETGRVRLAVSIRYNRNTRAGTEFIYTACGKTTSVVQSIGISKAPVTVSYELAASKTVIEPGDSRLGYGLHAYAIDYLYGDTDARLVTGSGFIFLSPVFKEVYKKSFNISYLLAATTVKMPEVASPTVTVGHPLVTVALNATVANARWSVVGTPAVAVGVAGLAGSETTKGVVSLAAETVLDYDSGAEFLTVTIQAVTPDTEGSLMQAQTRLVIRLSVPGLAKGISADASGLSALTPSSRLDTLPVRLSDQPAGGQNVTLSVTSATPAELTAAPAHLVFTPSDWSTAQTVTVGLTDAIVSAKGTNKNIDVTFAVHDAGNSASNYRGVDAVTVPVAINIVNVAPEFDAGSLEGTIEENGEGEKTAVGAVVGTVQAMDANRDGITYSILNSVDGVLFGIGSSTGIISVAVATNFDYDSSQNMYTISVRAHDGTAGENGEFVLRVTDEPEPPAPASGIGGSQYFLVKNAIAGQVRNNVTLAGFVDPDGKSTVMYTVLNKPAWLTPAGSNVVNIGPTAPEGGHLLTIQASDGDGTSTVSAAVEVLREPSLTRWRLAAGKPEIEIASQYCAAAGRHSSAFLFPLRLAVSISYNNGTRAGEEFVKDPLTTGRCGGTHSVVMSIGVGDAPVMVSYRLTDTETVIKPGDSRLGVGLHAYAIDYVYGDTDVETTIGFHLKEFYKKRFNISYLLAAATVTIAEVILPTATVGHPLVTATLSATVANARWSVLGTPAVAVGVAGLAGSETTEGLVTLAAAAALDYESGADFLTVTIQAVTPDGEASLVQAQTRLVIRLSDEEIEEPQYSLTSAEYENNGNVAVFTVTEDAGCPFFRPHLFEIVGVEGEQFLSCKTQSISDSPENWSVSVDDDDPIYTLKITVSAFPQLAGKPITLRVHLGTFVSLGEAAQTGSFVDFVLAPDAGIDASPGALSVLTPSSRSDTLPVQLDGAPIGGNVTVTLTSANAGHVAVAPAALVFTPGNWSQAQNATMSLTDAGATVKGSRSVNVELAVHDQANSAGNYRSVPTVTVSVAVSVTNAAPTLATIHRRRSIDENIGTSATTAAGTAIGVPIVAEDPDDRADELTYGLVGISPLFGMDPATGQITLSAATNLNHEDVDQYMVTVRVEDNEESSIRGRALVTVLITVNDVNEPPALGVLLDQTVAENVGGSYQFAAAEDPDAGDNARIVYTAARVGSGNVLTSVPASGEDITFNPSTRTFTFAASLAGGTEVTLRVTASDGSLSAERDFVLRVSQGGGGAIVANTSGLTALSRLNREAVFVVQLNVQPRAQAVTITMASLAAGDVRLRPAAMTFDRSNWNIAQSATVRLSDAGLAVKGSRVVSLSLGVHDRANSDSLFQSSVPRTVVVQVANANAATEFSLPMISTIELAVDENFGRLTQTADVTIGDPIVATDEDNAELIYTLVDAPSEFRIGASDGQLVAAAGVNFNHERQSSYELVVQASDGESSSPGIAQVTVTVRIGDIEEKPGNYGSHGLTVSGRARNDITLGWNNDEYETQFDEFDRASIVVSYGGGGYAGTLALEADATSARLVGLVPGVAYALTLHWYSADGLAQDAAAVVRGVMSQANNAPVFDGDLRYRRPENVGSALTPAGTELAVVAATDAQGDPVTYSIRGGADAGLFAIDPRTGVVRLVRALNFDHEGKNSYTFRVAATDTYGASTTGALILNITEVDERPSLPIQFAQTAVAGQETTFMVRAAVDPESGTDVEYQAEQESGQALPSWLDLDHETGEFTVTAGAEEGIWRIRVRALVAAPAGSSQFAAAAGVPVALNEPAVASERVLELAVAADASNNRPSFADAARRFALAENRQLLAGTAVGTVAATDADAGAALTYELRGADARPFAIGAGGTLSIREDVAFDRESKDSYRFVVDVDDSRGGLASTEVRVTINDVNEAPQFLSAPRVQQAVSRTRSTIFVSPAVDLDEGDSLTYSARVPAGGWLTFDAARLRMTVAANAPLGRSEVTLVATDRGGMSAQHVFALQVQVAGNLAPEVVGDMQFELVLASPGQMTAAGTEIGTIVAVDPEGTRVTYRMVEELFDASLFRVSASGRIEVAADVVLAQGRVYRIAVEAEDEDGAVAQIVALVRVGQATALDAGQQQEDEVAVLVMDRALAAAAVELLQARLDRSPASSSEAEAASLLQEEPLYMRMASAVDQWRDWRYDHASDADRIERMQWQDFLYGRGFDFALADAGSRGPQMRLWGAGSRYRLDGSPVENNERVYYDGDARLFMVGLEVGQARTRVGLAAGRSKSELKLGKSADAQVQREVEVVYPYLSFRMSERVRLWAAGGFGTGDYVRVEGSDDETGREVRHMSASGGFDASWGYGPLELVAGLKALMVRSRLMKQVQQDLPEIRGNSWRLQADFEAARAFSVFSEVALRPFVGAHIRHDGGDWLAAQAMDTTAGMSLDWSRGLKAQFSARWQVNEDATNERRFDASVSYDFGSDGRGLMLSVSPNMVSSSKDAPFSRAVSASAGYGLPVQLLAESGIVTFSADFSYSGSGSSLTDSYGFRFAGRRLDVDLAAAGDTYRLNLRIQ